MLINLETAHLAPPAPAVPAEQPVSEVEVVETVTVTPKLSQSREHLSKLDDEWGWRELRDYVVEQIERRHGLFPRNPKQEFGIFSRFSKTFGVNAGKIARHAFDFHGGYWLGAPISVTRFSKGSDPYFAQPILEELGL